MPRLIDNFKLTNQLIAHQAFVYNLNCPAFARHSLPSSIASLKSRMSIPSSSAIDRITLTCQPQPSCSFYAVILIYVTAGVRLAASLIDKCTRQPLFGGESAQENGLQDFEDGKNYHF